MLMRRAALVGALTVTLGIGACGGSSNRSAGSRPPPALSGSIRIDGASTVSPLTKTIARRFVAEHPRVHVTVNHAGDARGFARLCRGQTDLADASMPIDAQAIDTCERHDTAWHRITLANDAVMLSVNPRNPIRCLTTDQLMQIWRGNAGITGRWSQVGGTVPAYDESLIAWGPGTDTETFAFFTWAVNREQGVTRDYNNALEFNSRTLEHVALDPGAIGYADYRLYRRRNEAVKLLAVDSGDGCVRPSPRTIADGSFRPFSRKLFLYVSDTALRRPAVAAFLRAYLADAAAAVRRVGFVALTPAQLASSRANLDRLIARAADE